MRAKRADCRSLPSSVLPVNRVDHQYLANSKLVRWRYTTVKIAEVLAKELDKIAKTHEYRSRTDIVKYAIRKFIEERRKGA